MVANPRSPPPLGLPELLAEGVAVAPRRAQLKQRPVQLLAPASEARSMTRRWRQPTGPVMPGEEQSRRQSAARREVAQVGASWQAGAGQARCGGSVLGCPLGAQGGSARAAPRHMYPSSAGTRTNEKMSHAKGRAKGLRLTGMPPSGPPSLCCCQHQFIPPPFPTLECLQLMIAWQDSGARGL